MNLRARLTLTAGAALTVAVGCAGLLSSAPSARVARFNCQVDAVQPVLGDVLDAADLVRSLYKGSADLDVALAAAGATEAEVRALAAALRACEGPPPPPDPDAGLSPS